MEQVLPHISIGVHDDGHLILAVGDYELFDFIEDYLGDKYDIAYEYRTSAERVGGEIITVHFPAALMEDELRSALAKLDVDEIERIFRLNNQVD